MCSSIMYYSSHHDPSLTYGKAKDPPEPLFLPQFVLLDGKCLSFTGYTIQTFEDPCDYPFRVRRVKISYFLIDDTIAVSEPAIEVVTYFFVPRLFRLKKKKIQLELFDLIFPISREHVKLISDSIEDREFEKYVYARSCSRVLVHSRI